MDDIPDWAQDTTTTTAPVSDDSVPDWAVEEVAQVEKTKKTQSILFSPVQKRQYELLLRNPKTTTEQFSKWFVDNKLGKPENAEEVLSFFKKNPKAAIGNYFNKNELAPTENIPTDDNNRPQPGTPTDWLPDSVQDWVEQAGLSLGIIDPKTYYGRGNYGENAVKPSDPDLLTNPAIPSWGARVARSAGETFSEAGTGVNAMLLRGTKDVADDDAIRRYASEHNWTPQQLDAVLNQAKQERANVVAEERQQIETRNEDEARREGGGIRGSLKRGSADMLGAFIGDTNPTYRIAGPASSILGRMATQGAVNAGTNVMSQTDEMMRDENKVYDPSETALHFALGAGFQGGADILGKLPSVAAKWLKAKLNSPSALDELAANGIDVNDLPAGVSPKEIVKAVNDLKAVKNEAEQFQGTPEPKPTDMSPAEESRVADAEAWAQEKLDVTSNAKTFYRETSPERAQEVFPTTPNTTSGLEGDYIYLADHPDLALGQGSNKGVKLEFDGTNLKTRANKKPGQSPELAAKGQEYIGENTNSVYSSSLRKVTVSAERIKEAEELSKKFDYTERGLPSGFEKNLVDLEQAGWVKEINSDGSVSYTKPKDLSSKEEQPKVYYHGSSRMFDQYDPVGGGRLGDGVFLTPEREYAEGFARERPDLFFKSEELGGGPSSTPIASQGNLRHNEVTIKNTYEWNPTTDNASPSFLKKLKEDGYDSIRTHTKNGNEELFVFDPNNIKTTKIEPLSESITKKEAASQAVGEQASVDTPVQEAPTITPEETVTKLTDALKNAGKVREEQTAMYKQERAKRFAQVAKAQEQGGGRAAYEKSLKALSGELPKPDFEEVGSKFTPDEVNSLFEVISSSEASPATKFNAQHGLEKLLQGKLPQPKELEHLSEVFPQDFIKAALSNRRTMKKAGELLSDVWNAPKSLQSTADISGPMRQGLGLIHRGEFWKSLVPMVRAAVSPKYSDALEKSIKSHPNYDIAKEAGLSVTTAGKIGEHEDFFRSHLAEKIPVWGKVIRGSERAFVGFLNKTRFDTFNTMLNQAKSIGHDIDDPAITKGISRYINVMTGRGGLGSLEKASTTLNNVFYSPGLISSRLQILAAPVQAVAGKGFIAELPKGMRMEAAKSYAAIIAFNTTALSLAVMNGKDVSLDPFSTDFLKMKDGNTRLDFGGGLQQYIVAGARALGRKATSTVENSNTRDLDVRGDTPLDNDLRFVMNKMHPSLTLFLDQQRGKTTVGEPFEWQKAIIDRITPMGFPDIVATLKEHGSDPGVYYGLMGMIGIGLANYEDSKDQINTNTEEVPSGVAEELEAPDWAIEQ